MEIQELKGTIEAHIKNLEGKQREAIETATSEFAAKHQADVQKLGAEIVELRKGMEDAEARYKSALLGQQAEEKQDFDTVLAKSVSEFVGKKGQSAAHGVGGRASFDIKAVLTNPMAAANPERQPVAIRPLVSHVRDYVVYEPISGDSFNFARQGAVTGNFARTAEGAALAVVDTAWTKVTQVLQKIGGTSKITREMMEDEAQLVAAVQTVLREQFLYDEDAKLLLGAGGNNDVEGIYTNAVTAAGISPTKVPSGTTNWIDAIIAGMAGLLGSSGKFTPTLITMNPADILYFARTAKSTTGEYLAEGIVWDGPNGLYVFGVPVVGLHSVPSLSFGLGDFRQVSVKERRGLTVDMATENVDDFEKELVTMRLTERINTKISHQKAFFYDTFQNVKTKIELP